MAVYTFSEHADLTHVRQLDAIGSMVERHVGEYYTGDLTAYLQHFLVNLLAEVEGYVSDEVYAPEFSAEDPILCRYLSPEKLLMLLHARQIYFARPDQFGDVDGGTPCWARFVGQRIQELTRGRHTADRMGDESLIRLFMTEIWKRLFIKQKSVSCWFVLQTPTSDSHLMWETYAGGPWGALVTTRLATMLQLPFDERLELTHGPVEYGHLWRYPFCKDILHSGEGEYRFALDSKDGAPFTGSVEINHPEKFVIETHPASASPSYSHAVLELAETAGFSSSLI